MQIIDTHCDALLKLWENPKRSFINDPKIDANLERLKRGQVKIQCFALFVEPFIRQEQKFQVILEQVDLFNEKVVKPNPEIKHIKSWDDIQTLKSDEIGAILTLEGLDGIGDDLTKLRILFQLGVLSVGLTWNQANLFADGVGELRGAGLSTLGKLAVQANNDNKILTDVSHLHINGFWDVIELADYPIASHSNAYTLCDHPRNLNDEQIHALVKKRGYIGIVFHPLFLTGQDFATITDVIKHIEHMCNLGASEQIGFGSDFDGISVYVNGLRHAGQFQHLINELQKHYSEQLVRGFAGENFRRLIPQ
nr:dipeptidase [Halalkalibacter urbisdiaboli]